MPTGAYGTSNAISATPAAVFRPNVWSNEVLMFVKANLVLVPLIRHYDAEVQSYGQTVEIPNVSTISAALKSANTLVTLSLKRGLGVVKSLLNTWNPAFSR